LICKPRSIVQCRISQTSMNDVIRNVYLMLELFNESMISFSSFPVIKENRQDSHPQDASHDNYMDLDQDDSQINGSRLTWPGEMLTSSHEYMR